MTGVQLSDCDAVPGEPAVTALRISATRDPRTTSHGDVKVQVEPAGPPLTIEFYSDGTWIVNGKRWSWWRRLLARRR